MPRLNSLTIALILFAIPPATQGATITGKITATGLTNASEAVVYIATAPGTFTPAGDAVLEQRDIQFRPHVLPIVVGSTVKFTNADDVQHNVFTPSPAGDLFNLGTWLKGGSKLYTFRKMGKVEVLCNIHHEMRSFILVLQNPYFAVADKNGNYHIANVPDGTYQLKVWHERGAGSPKTIEVAGGGTQVVNFELAAR